MNDSAHLANENRFPDGGAPVPSIRDSAGTKLIPLVLSVIAGSVDIISFLVVGGLFAGEQVPPAYLIAIPMFMVALGLTKLLAAGLERIRIGSLLPVLLLQFLLLSAFFAICSITGPIDPAAAIMVVAGMLGVSVMAAQNALVRISLRGAPARARSWRSATGGPFIWSHPELRKATRVHFPAVLRAR
jgi:uncharacterized membrane protein YoaK (UPF0700 family)